jgi:hypothetical protein
MRSGGFGGGNLVGFFGSDFGSSDRLVRCWCRNVVT